METLQPTTTGVYTPNPTCFTTTNLWYNDVGNTAIERIAFSDCPVGMTPAWSSTGTELQDVSLVTSYCCPTGFDFSVTASSAAGTQWANCIAASIEQFSGQTLTLTQNTYWSRVIVAGTPTTIVLVTTMTTPYDYERDLLSASPATIWKYIYPGAETTSTCYGLACNPSNPLPQPPEKTPPPSTFTYTPPSPSQ
ncbi:hypothetical protein B0T21DRAFT_409662 [Apiosordaria backusii]|uniref:Uncharacterized protein n=1 Tax=Apiosordaria backusii TaxID=314023 RepID=A0AA40BRZ1_9PEZI|nr:hypothetical protein B0T21DRAFT_409662 [Apiosordaria backusii]